MQSLVEISETLKLLADKTRLTILALLKEQELCVCNIVDIMEMSQPNTSQHLRKLKNAGLVREARRGQWVYYSLNIDNKPFIQAILDSVPSMKESILTADNKCDS